MFLATEAVPCPYVKAILRHVTFLCFSPAAVAEDRGTIDIFHRVYGLGYTGMYIRVAEELIPGGDNRAKGIFRKNGKYINLNLY